MSTTFNQNIFDATQQPMFFGEPVNVARYDKQKYPIFEKLTEKQLSFFWRPEEVDLTKDRQQFQDLPDHEKHIFTSNLKYQTLLDSVQGRSPNLAFLPIVSLPELETWIETWSFSETVHSRSYTHIIRNIYNDPSEVFDSIMHDKHIIDRATAVTEHYDRLLNAIDGYKLNPKNDDRKENLYLCMMSVNILEAIRFYVSFACSFAFAERSIMEGNAKIIKFIARDEALHLTGTQNIINIMQSGRDDFEFHVIAKDKKQDCINMFNSAAKQEKDWASYLFKDGSMIGLNESILGQYVDHIASVRMRSVNLTDDKALANPLPWMSSWLTSDNVQVAPQEAEISSYLTGQIDSSVEDDDFDGFDL